MHNRDIDRHIDEQLVNLHGLLKSLDHGGQNLRHDWDVDDLRGRSPQPARENL